jgi:16S rRNA (guanine(966)-N(2))-methyltransferase RsmD
VPQGKGIRPTSERVRESLFSILADVVEGCVVLDLFAGSGALGIEALSRGARYAVLCDEKIVCVRAIQENVKRCGFVGRAIVLHLKIPEELWKIRKGFADPVDLVFLDPPYGAEDKERLLKEFDRFAFLREHARIVFEHSQKDPLLRVPGGFVLEEQRGYGDTVLTLLSYQPGDKRDNER